MTAPDKTMDILNLQFTGSENGTQLIVFTIESEEFGVEVLNVQEIIRYLPAMKVPKAPSFVQGVINFRGRVIPVLELRRVFELDTISYNQASVIIVVETNGKTFGITVENVSDIISLPDSMVQKVPELSCKERTKYLKAMGKQGERMIFILDLDQLIDFRELEETLFKPKNNQ